MKRTFFHSFLLASLGSLSFALAVALFYDPNRIAAGGITGFAIIISHLVPFLNTGTIVILTNIPLLILSFFRFGKKFVAITIYATALSSLLMNVLGNLLHFAYSGDDLFIPALCGAMLDAIGLGFVYRAGGCTGGTDIIIKFMRQKYRHIRTGVMYSVLNLTVLIATFIAFKNIEIAVYSAIAMIVSSFLLDKILYIGEGAKLVYIISDRYKEITDALLNEMQIGVTFLKGEGAYTKKEKNIILCAIKPHFFTRMREIIKNIDANAFVIIGNATEIFGEGYKSQFIDEI